jgi:hypothetical protein
VQREKFIVKQNFSFSVTVPLKEELDHRVRSPPEAPIAITKSKQSKCQGAKFLMKVIEAHNQTSTFLQFVTHSIPFARSIKPLNLLAQNVPDTIIHKKN